MTTKEPTDLKAKLKKADPGIGLFVTSLERENLTLHRTIAKLQTQEISNRNRIKALEKELEKESTKHQFTLNTIYAGFDPKLSHEQMEKLITDKAKELGYRLEKLA